MLLLLPRVDLGCYAHIGAGYGYSENFARRHADLPPIPTPVSFANHDGDAGEEGKAVIKKCRQKEEDYEFEASHGQWLAWHLTVLRKRHATREATHG